MQWFSSTWWLQNQFIYTITYKTLLIGDILKDFEYTRYKYDTADPPTTNAI